MIVIPRRWADTTANEWSDIDAYAAGRLKLGHDVVSHFERAVADYVGAPHAAAISSGRRGMRMIFEHLGVGAGDEVVVPAYTLDALIPLIQDLGAVPVTADVHARTMNVTRQSIEHALSSRTKALLVLHAFGAPAPMTDILALAEERGIAVVEDCAHALGATHQGRALGTLGYAGFYSFEPTKPVNTYGGGMVVSADEALIDKVRAYNAAQTEDLGTFVTKAKTVQREQSLFRSGLAFPILAALSTPGIRGPVNALYRSRQSVPSGAAAFSRIQAHLGLEKLDTLPHRLEARNRLADLYRSLLGPDMPVQQVAEGDLSTWYFLTATLPRPAKNVRARLLWSGVDAAVEEEIMDDCAAMLHQGGAPQAARLFLHNLVLPLYDGMTESDARRAAEKLKRLI